MERLCGGNQPTPDSSFDRSSLVGTTHKAIGLKPPTAHKPSVASIASLAALNPSFEYSRPSAATTSSVMASPRPTHRSLISVWTITCPTTREFSPVTLESSPPPAITTSGRRGLSTGSSPQPGKENDHEFTTYPPFL